MPPSKTDQFEQYIWNDNVDDSVTPHALVLGIKAKDDADGYTALTSTTVGSDQGLDVNIIGGSSAGTEYTEGDTDASITGTVTMWEDAADTIVATSADKPLPVAIISGAGSGGTASDDDADFTAGTTSGTPAMGVYESSPTSVTDGDMGIVGITVDRKLKVETGLSQPLEDGGNVVVTGSALPTGAATAANQSTAIGHLSTIAGDTTSLDGKDLMLGTDFSDVFGTASLISATPAIKVEQQGSVAVTGTFWQATQPVSLASVPSHAVTNAGTFATQATLQAGTAAIGKILPTDEDVTAHTNYARKYYTNAGAVTDGIIWSPAAGKRWHVTTMYINVSAAATVTLEDDKAGGDDPVWKGEIAANSGVVLQFHPLYPMASGEDAADLLITTSAGNVYCTVVGYEV